jgi:hypothetical protein
LRGTCALLARRLLVAGERQAPLFEVAAVGGRRGGSDLCILSLFILLFMLLLFIILIIIIGRRGGAGFLGTATSDIVSEEVESLISS